MFPKPWPALIVPLSGLNNGDIKWLVDIAMIFIPRHELDICPWKDKTAFYFLLCKIMAILRYEEIYIYNIGNEFIYVYLVKILQNKSYLEKIILPLELLL